MQYTDEQLKQTLAKILPEVLVFDSIIKRLSWRNHPNFSCEIDVIDTELIHLVWLVECSLTPDQWDIYAESWNNLVKHFRERCTATWQQRTIALAQTLGIEIV